MCSRLLFLLSFVSFVVLFGLPSWARAAPPAPLPPEERFVAGDLDAEDLAAGPNARFGGSAWVSLVGFSQATAGGTREVGGFLVVGLPFDRIARGAPRAAWTDPVAPPPEKAKAPLPVPGELDTPIALTPRLARASVAAAWRVAGLGADDSRLDAIMSRARWSGLLPEARLRVIRSDDERIYADSTNDRTRDSASANVGLEARLTWRLDRLLFADDEGSFERIRLERQDARARIAGRVLEALFRWQRAWLEMRAAPKEAEPALRVFEAEATLDVLTGGWFSAWRTQRLVLVLPTPLSE